MTWSARRSQKTASKSPISWKRPGPGPRDPCRRAGSAGSLTTRRAAGRSWSARELQPGGARTPRSAPERRGAVELGEGRSSLRLRGRASATTPQRARVVWALRVPLLLAAIVACAARPLVAATIAAPVRVVRADRCVRGDESSAESTPTGSLATRLYPRARPAAKSSPLSIAALNPHVEWFHLRNTQERLQEALAPSPLETLVMWCGWPLRGPEEPKLGELSRDRPGSRQNRNRIGPTSGISLPRMCPSGVS